ncbi:hypothetical protein HMPREF0293_2708 [Corynebacterium glucuronolyticum ATCC 51866]|uniref:Uncharacterized protein n=1 Tax=Corynebacterium glucuronolyticum ATCC 51866 TaxID=548478 RepID=A0ABM9XL46_9CORY|nr:hypothetical protein HMPREF0293_2708 [Corynebacterium glucuronolyticum ATCC 51866]OFO47000.1 hypothetical protein HMPREF3044_10155 [Corynebacterium sp. HMSC073D01]
MHHFNTHYFTQIQNFKPYNLTQMQVFNVGFLTQMQYFDFRAVCRCYYNPELSNASFLKQRKERP